MIKGPVRVDMKAVKARKDAIVKVSTEGVEQRLRGVCPNCGGELVPRAHPPALKLPRYPSSAVRTVKPHGCAPPA